MHEPAWKRLVEDLSDDSFESPYLERLRARVGSAATARQDIAREVIQEMAGALGRSEDRVNESLLRLDVLGRQIDALASEKPRDERWRRKVNALVDRFNEERQLARTRLWELRVHREAVGFLRANDGLAELYPIPPARDRLG